MEVQNWAPLERASLESVPLLMVVFLGTCPLMAALLSGTVSLLRYALLETAFLGTCPLVIALLSGTVSPAEVCSTGDCFPGNVSPGDCSFVGDGSLGDGVPAYFIC